MAEGVEQPRSVLAQTLRWVNALNDRFVAAARYAGGWVRRAERLVGRKVPLASEAPSASTSGEEQLLQWARVRLSELHLRVGRSIDRLDIEDEIDSAEVRRQLLALLDEIERLKGILLHAGGAAGTGRSPEEIDEEVAATPRPPNQPQPDREQT